MKKNSTFKFVSKIVALCGIVFVIGRIIDGNFSFGEVAIATMSLAVIII